MSLIDQSVPATVYLAEASPGVVTAYDSRSGAVYQFANVAPSLLTLTMIHSVNDRTGPTESVFKDIRSFYTTYTKIIRGA